MDQNIDLREKRREEIIHAAMEVFSKYGYQQAKMEDIAAEAGIGKGTIYEYFPSKKQLFEDMICSNLDIYKKRLRAILQKEESFCQKFHNLCQYNADFLNEHMDILQFISQQGVTFSYSMKKRLFKEQQEIFDMFSQMIEKAIADGEIREGIDREAAVICILAIITQLTGKRVFVDRANIRDIDSQPFLDILMRGLSRQD